ncbi:MAG: M23 family metallopeptidase [Spirochaetota bacterium]
MAYQIKSRVLIFRSICGELRRILLFIPYLFLLAFLSAHDAPTQDYTVGKGDTLYSLARRYGVSVNEIMRVNSLESSTELKPGMLLKIPAKNFPGQGSRSEESTKSGYSTHTVSAGETFYAISRRYSMPMSELLALNGLTPNAVLRQGQTLVVKGSSSANTGSATPVRKKTMAGSSAFNDVADYYWPASGRREVLDDKLEGVRILALDRSLVYAVRDGTVMWQGPYRSYGVVTLIASSDGYIYLYGGNVHFLVNAGQEISKGDPLGKVDSEVGNQLAGQSQAYQGYNQKLATANQYPNQVYFSVFRNGEFVPVQNAPRS